MHTPRIQIDNLAVFRLLKLGLTLAEEQLTTLTAEEQAQILLGEFAKSEKGKPTYKGVLIDALLASENLKASIVNFMEKYQPKKPAEIK